jgi:hypothetical protein
MGINNMSLGYQISERLYEFAVNFEEYNKHKNIYIINQVVEKTFGFDAMFFIQKNSLKTISKLKLKIIVLQYKIPTEYNVKQLTPKTANFNKIRHKPWSAGGFFRFEIANSLDNSGSEKVFDQHNQLLDLTQSRGITAYYVAPRFLDINALYQQMGNNSVIANSVMISFNHLPRLKKMIKPIKPFNHYMYYDSVNDYHKLCSDEYEFHEFQLTYNSIVEALKESQSIALSEILSDEMELSMDDVCKKILEYLNITQKNIKPYILIE